MLIPDSHHHAEWLKKTPFQSSYTSTLQLHFLLTQVTKWQDHLRKSSSTFCWRSTSQSLLMTVENVLTKIVDNTAQRPEGSESGGSKPRGSELRRRLHVSTMQELEWKPRDLGSMFSRKEYLTRKTQGGLEKVAWKNLFAGLVYRSLLKSREDSREFCVW